APDRFLHVSSPLRSFFLHGSPPTAIYTLSLHDALPILLGVGLHDGYRLLHDEGGVFSWWDYRMAAFRRNLGLRIDLTLVSEALRDRKSTRLNSSHVKISYAVFCLKKKRLSRVVAAYLMC